MIDLIYLISSGDVHSSWNLIFIIRYVIKCQKYLHLHYSANILRSLWNQDGKTNNYNMEHVLSTLTLPLISSTRHASEKVNKSFSSSRF